MLAMKANLLIYPLSWSGTHRLSHSPKRHNLEKIREKSWAVRTGPVSTDNNECCGPGIYQGEWSQLKGEGQIQNDLPLVQDLKKHSKGITNGSRQENLRISIEVSLPWQGDVGR